MKLQQASEGRLERKADGSLSRRKALLGIGAIVSVGDILEGVAARAAEIPRAIDAPGKEADHPTVSPSVSTMKHEVLEVGPGKRFASLTLAGAFMNSAERWNNGYTDSAHIAKMAFRVVISPGPPGYYTNDSGSHSRRWPSLVGWPPYEGNLLGPVIIEGEQGKPAPILDTDGYGDGVLYYQAGLFITGSCDATFRRLVFRGFRRRDGYGNYAAVRLGSQTPKLAMNSNVVFEDCEISGCDNGIMGGAPGQSLTLRRCYIHDNGNGTGRVHNIYFGNGDVLTMEDSLSTRVAIGHLLKSRAAHTIIKNSRLLGGGGSESACIDVPDGGILEIDKVVCEKSPDTDANWIIHYSGENQDTSDMYFHNPSSISIRNLLMIAPSIMRKHTSWGSVIGFANASGAGIAQSGKGSHYISADAKNVQVFGLSAKTAGLPCQSLSARPQLDLSSPVRA